MTNEIGNYHDKLESLIPLEMIENEAQSQIFKNLSHPFLKKMVILPDCHTGYNLPIGAVALLENVISPSYVGYDQGCGMCSVRTELKYSEITESEKWNILNKIYNTIPVGFNSRSKPADYPQFSLSVNDGKNKKKIDSEVNSKLRKQLGTLGGGNHFIEIGPSDEGYLAVIIHSGSRRPGWLVADYYMKLSKEVDTDLPKDFLHYDSDYGEAYEKDLTFMLNFALENRLYMMQNVLEIIGFSEKEIEQFLDDVLINENHNHAVVYDKENSLILHRKGATPADNGQLGIIPGNMRDGSYITVGLGNEKYLSSASHGAGRKMSRKKAKENISIDDLKQDMDGKISRVTNSMIDESPRAYKELDDVIEMQKGVVVDMINKVRSDINIKG